MGNDFFVLSRLVEEGLLEEGTIQNWLSEHNGQMSQAFQQAESYSPQETPEYCQVGQAQSKSLGVSF